MAGSRSPDAGFLLFDCVRDLGDDYGGNSSVVKGDINSGHELNFLCLPLLLGSCGGREVFGLRFLWLGYLGVVVFLVQSSGGQNFYFG